MQYKTLYEKSANFYRKRPLALKALIACNYFLTGTFFAAYGALIIYAFVNALGVWDLCGIFAVPAFCLVFISVLRKCIARPRPYSEKGANIQPLIIKNSKNSCSFPSRHLASAYVIAMVVLFHFTPAGICLLSLGLLLGYVRFALGLHYPSDLFGGAIFGALCGLLFLLF